MNRQILTLRQQNAGLDVIEDSHRVYLVRNHNKYIRVLPKNCTPKIIQGYAEKYLNEIDWQGQ